MGALLPSISDVISTSTANSASLFTYLGVPLLGFGFAVAAVVVGIKFARRWLHKGLNGAAGTGRRGGRRRRR